MQEQTVTLFGLSESVLRFGLFASTFAIMALAEWMLPKKHRTQPKGRRWLTNWGIIFADVVIVRLLVPIAPVAVAFYAANQGWGLLNMLDLPAWLSVLIGFVVLDFAIWLQHLLSHIVPVLWRLHQVHHADRDIDVSTALRFHPIEILLSLAYKMIWIIVLGAPAMAVFAFEAVLNAAALFNHANVRFAPRLDAALRLLIVTPDMHRVHHSVRPEETNSNYGFNLSIWDRWFGTYIAQPKAGHADMRIGLNAYQSDKPSQFSWTLLLPFRNK
ncbi:MAG: sterol desaturase family protein [Cohaesibacter sp.]|jgi:sterol desaturase/sphingolipid hydroxylase (fatty acid hydroxylase superfamily)|nr:sterol desaturase family protein [Cohaesibacter sp.]